MQLAGLIDAIPVVHGAGDRAQRFASPAIDQRVHDVVQRLVQRWNGATWQTDLVTGASTPGPWFNLALAPYNAGQGADDTAAVAQAIADAQAVFGRVLFSGPLTYNLTVNQGLGYAALITAPVEIHMEPGAKIFSNVAPAAASLFQVNTIGATVPVDRVRFKGLVVDAQDSVDMKIVRLTYTRYCTVEECDLSNVSPASVNSAAGVWVEGTQGAPLTISSLTRVGNVATVVTAVNHGYATGDYVLVSGTTQRPYNGIARITVTGLATYTYIVTRDVPTTPATGTPVCKKLYFGLANVVRRCHVYDIGTAVAPQAIYCFTTRGTIVEENTVERGGRGIYFDGPNVGGRIATNAVLDVGDNGIRINPGTAGTGTFIENEGAAVVGNYIENPLIDGIRLNCISFTCADNIVVRAGQVGIKSDVAQDGAITGNEVYGCGLEGIMLFRTVTVNEVSGPHLRVAIVSNTVVGNGSWGIRVMGGGVSTVDLALGIEACLNTVYANAAGGIAFFNVDRGFILDNTVQENTNGLSSSDKPGIYVAMDLPLTSAGGVRVAGNRAWDLRAGGVFRQNNGVQVDPLTAGATLNNVVVEDNDISDSPNAGVRIAVTAGTLGPVRVRRNDCANCGQGISGRIATDFIYDNYAVRALAPISADRGDTSPSLSAGVDSPTQLFATALTANRTCTLSKSAGTSLGIGSRFRVTRTGLGAFTLTVQDSTPTTIKVFPSGQASFGDFVWNGTAWVEEAFGAL